MKNTEIKKNTAQSEVNIDGLNEFSINEMKERIARDTERLQNLNEFDAKELQAKIDERQARVDAWTKANR